MADLSNCPECGKLFVKAMRPVCEECARKREEQFELVSGYMRKRENRQASLEDVHAHTGVDKDVIIQFLREGRLRLSQFPNLAFPCEKCGADIREGRICAACRKEINDGIAASEREKSFQERKDEQERAKVQTYSTLEDRVNRRRR
ncbi:TIGR03826 family flagellar region protein [Salisediminibacterium halotolerans]|uniref:TIGR03826 family flagellar region protein n=1 Tax=Salisediminibacterium halotolerans TaxID=517425 RepID=UPI000EACD00C|nr:TIGR03826 family flagellar region protein [Salisediminibacterium halotolerans]RLJ75546.1 flagellar operon protein (TIGR03826 family) [Actinophytocola xinjiangensis]RPE89399.1 flagellar operon protein (TIGR03826 family) [Salisediminibacterium halotolerans]TWG36159.1 flagellar operon protein (TIGR03826 family) [Salisediminibacterium halotolerans]GEL07636.1 hypothetical protein SHA02_10520 [Salisediminibacterium halotolerans]